MRPLVLHVVEALGGGVTSAVEDFIRSTPGFRHRVLASLRAESHSAASLREAAGEVDLLRDGIRRRIRDVRTAVRRLRPAVVHAHSSFAGGYVRLAGIDPRRVVYTPHCYAFERLDIPTRARALYWTLEAALSFRGRTVAAVSAREGRLARRLPGRQRVVVVPNVARVPETPPPVAGERLEDVVAVALGRTLAQKDPAYFAAAVRASREAGLPVVWRWIGGGDPETERRLRDAGVEVTGWIERDEALRHLQKADVYVHTAAWEGFPITVLEAAAMGKPIVARRIPALEETSLSLVDEPGRLAVAVGAMREPGARAAAVDASRRLAREHDPAHQERVLSEIYGRVASGS
jgi:glycosyltransferase involved in cell wall biosynthesis